MDVWAVYSLFSFINIRIIIQAKFYLLLHQLIYLLLLTGTLLHLSCFLTESLGGNRSSSQPEPSHKKTNLGVLNFNDISGIWKTDIFRHGFLWNVVQICVLTFEEAAVDKSGFQEVSPLGWVSQMFLSVALIWRRR